MRTNIDIDDTLMQQAMAALGLTTKKDTVEEALRYVIRLQAQNKAFASLRGIGWEGDLEAMRLGDQDRAP